MGDIQTPKSALLVLHTVRWPLLTATCDKVVLYCIQESGLAVALQLLAVRVEEAAERLLPVLAPAAAVLQQASQQLGAWLSVQKAACTASSEAQAAHAEAARLQVHSSAPRM